MTADLKEAVFIFKRFLVYTVLYTYGTLLFYNGSPAIQAQASSIHLGDNIICLKVATLQFKP